MSKHCSSVNYLSHRELGALLGDHVVLLLVELPPVSQLAAQFLQLNNLDRDQLSHVTLHICIELKNLFAHVFDLGRVIEVQLSTSQLLQLARQLVNLKYKS